jgi:hypothetical protein
MMKTGSLMMTVLVVALLGAAAGACSEEEGDDMAGTLVIGAAAPLFSLPGSDGKTYRLEDFAGKQAVVIAWYPKAFTGG